MQSSVVKEKARSSYMTRNRLGVSLLFLLNGFVMGSWAPQIPAFSERMGLSEAQLGFVILSFGIGSLLLMPIAGAYIGKCGSRVISLFTGLALVPLLLFISMSNSLVLGVVAVVIFGGIIGAMDVAMNANAVATERNMRRAIMSSCHAFWSLGGLIGAASGGLIMTWIGTTWHAFTVMLVGAILLVIAWPMVFHDRPDVRLEKKQSKLPLSPLPWLIGIMALFSMIPEGAILDWGALYLRNDLDASLSASGFAFAAFSLTMAIMRFAGDLIRERLGAVNTLRACTVFAIAGLLIAGLAPNVGVALFGFALTGIGISNMVPIAFSAGGNIPGLAPGVGLSVVTVMGYSGILIAPSLIGFIAEYSGLAIVFICLPLLLVVVLMLSRLASHADRVGIE